MAAVAEDGECGANVYGTDRIDSSGMAGGVPAGVADLFGAQPGQHRHPGRRHRWSAGGNCILCLMAQKRQAQTGILKADSTWI